MPDSTGRECYQCEERFTTFRRRHHCRLCGQIFCAKCCSSHIDGAALGYMGELRLCDYCARKVQRLAEEGKQTPTTSTTRSQTPVNSRKISFDRNTAHKNSDTVRTVSNGEIFRFQEGIRILSLIFYCLFKNVSTRLELSRTLAVVHIFTTT